MDLNYPVGLTSQFMSQPPTEHLQCAHRILRYVSGTKDRALIYRHDITEQLVSDSDSDWAGDAMDRWSTSGFMFSLGIAVVAWYNKKQPTLALPSTEA